MLLGAKAKETKYSRAMTTTTKSVRTMRGSCFIRRTDKFFRDRHYLKKSFEKDLILTSDDETSSSRDGDDDALLRKEVSRLASGLGTRCFLCCERSERFAFHADVSETAIEQLKLHEEYDETKMERVRGERRRERVLRWW